jgi:hypothetical protein
MERKHVSARKRLPPVPILSQTVIEDSHYYAFVDWWKSLLDQLDAVICSRTLSPTELKHNRPPQPLTPEAKSLFLTCAYDSFRGYIEKHTVPYEDWTSLAFAALLNSLILNGFEDHCSIYLNNEWKFILTACSACNEKRVKYFQLQLVLEGFDCPLITYSTLTTNKQEEKDKRRGQKRTRDS